MSESGNIIGAHVLSCDQVLSSLKEVVPTKFSLMQNYPNPFNPATNIKFEIINRDFYDLKIYNLSGQLIISLFSEIKEPGFHNASWNSLDKNGFKVPTGTYLYVLKNSKYNQTKKMLLIK
jgi:flagellar hook assembly protein FlgD